MNLHKIIFAGPVGVGKTTAIQCLSDIPPVSTEQISTVELKNKTQTTVALDYGIMKLESGEAIHLYGIPGQQRFDFMWEILTGGAIGVIILIDNSNDDPWKDLETYTKAFKELINNRAVVFGITRLDTEPKPCLDEYRQYVQKLGVNVPVFEIDVRERVDIVVLIQALFFLLDPGMQTEQ